MSRKIHEEGACVSYNKNMIVIYSTLWIITIHRGIYYSCKLYNSYVFFVRCSTTTFDKTFWQKENLGAGQDARSVEVANWGAAVSATGYDAYKQQRLAKGAQFRCTI